MKTEDRYLKFVRWSDADGLYIGYCPDLFPWGGVRHGASEEDAYRDLAELVREEVEELRRDGKPLPEVATRPMREAVPAGLRPGPLILKEHFKPAKHAKGR